MSTFPRHPGQEQEYDRAEQLHLVPRGEKPRKALWKRIAIWTGIGVLALIAVVIVAILVLPHVKAFRQYALHVAEQKVASSLGTQVHVADFGLSLSRLMLDLYNLKVDGAPPHPTPPLLAIDHIHLQLGISSILHRQWYVKNIVIDRPVAHVWVDASGTNNLPEAKKSNSQSHTDLFQLGIRHALLDRGVVYFNNRKSDLDAYLHDLTLNARFNPGQQRYAGKVSYSDGNIQVGNYRPIPHDLTANFDLIRNAFQLNDAVLRSGPSHLDLSATVNDFSQPRVHATYSAVIDSGEFRRITQNPIFPIGVISAVGTLDYQRQPNVPALASVTLRGNLNSRLLQVNASGLQAQITALGANYSVANGNVVSDLRAGLLGGNLIATVTMHDLTGNSHSRMHAALKGISLAQVPPMMKSSALQQLSLGGTVNADADAAWGRSLNDMVARTNADIHARVAPRQNGRAEVVPVDGVIHATYVAARKEISLANSYVDTPQTSLQLNGTLSNTSSLNIRLQANNLHGLETIADSFRTAQGSQPPSQLGLYGTASFIGAVRGSTAAPHLTGQLQATNLRLKGSVWRVLRTDINVSPSLASLQNGVLQPADRGRITFNIRTALRKWSFSSTSPFQVGLNASQVNVAHLTKLAGSQTPVTGTLSTNIAVSGTELNPIGRGSVSLTNAKISSEPVQSLNLNFQGTGNEVHSNLTAQIPAGRADGAFSYFPKQQTYQAQLRALGLRLDKVHLIQAGNLELAGVLNITAAGQGSIKNPELTATIESPQLQVRKQILGDLRLQTNLADHLANISLITRAVDTVVNARAQVHTAGEYETVATVDTQRIPLQPVIALYAPAQAVNLTGQTELHATLRGPLKNKAAMDAHATIPVLQVNYANKVNIGAISPIHIDFTNGVLQLQRTDIRGTNTEVQLQASVPTSGSAPLSLLALGTVNLQIAQLFDPDITSSGELRFDINSYGARANPDVQGQVRIVNASIATGAAPIGLQNGNGVLTLTKDRLNIAQFTGTVGGGKVQASGGVLYKPSLRFDLAIAGKGIRLLYPEGVREGIDTNLTLTGTKEASLLAGQVKIDQLSFTPDFDLTSFMGQFGGAGVPPPASPGFTQNLQLNIGVQSTNSINLVSRELSIQGNANLTVRGTADQPVILGRVNLNGGDLILMGNRYVLQQGIIDFANPARTEPTVNLAANTTIQQYNIYLQFYGPADKLRTNYTSVPSLPPSDIINLLAFGKTSEASAANPSPGNLGAESLLASQVSSQVTSRIEKIAGISRLSVDPVLAGNGTQQNPGARITIQQRVTGNIFVTFATDVTQTQDQVIQLQYKLTPKVTLSGTRDQNGGFGFDTRIQKSW